MGMFWCWLAFSEAEQGQAMLAQRGYAVGNWLVHACGCSCYLGAAALAAKAVNLLILYLSHSWNTLYNMLSCICFPFRIVQDWCRVVACAVFVTLSHMYTFGYHSDMESPRSAAPGESHGSRPRPSSPARKAGTLEISIDQAVAS